MNYLKQIGYYMLFIILLTFICSLFNLIGISTNVTNILLLLFNTLAFFVLGFKNGIKSNRKGYISGLKIGLILLFLLFIVNLVINKQFIDISKIIYYIIILLSAVLGGMFGKAKKKED